MYNNQKPREITFLDIAFVAAALMMFTKTADVFVIFTPQIVTNMFGNVSQLYGMVNALIVEGVMTALHFHPRAQYSGRATVVKVILFVISAICQVYDSMVTNNTIAAQTDTVKLIFTNGVPLITALVVALLLWMGKLPEAGYVRKPFVGLKNLPAQWKWILDGEQGANTTPAMVHNAFDVPALDELVDDEDLALYEDEGEDDGINPTHDRHL